MKCDVSHALKLESVSGNREVARACQIDASANAMCPNLRTSEIYPTVVLSDLTRRYRLRFAGILVTTTHWIY